MRLKQILTEQRFRIEDVTELNMAAIATEIQIQRILWLQHITFSDRDKRITDRTRRQPQHEIHIR